MIAGSGVPDNNMITPIFKSHYSLKGRSILTLAKEDEIKDDYPVSIYAIAKTHKLDTVYLIEDNMAGFFEAFSTFDKSGIKLVYGISFIVTHDPESRADSEEGESKIWVFIKNSDGYKDLCKLYNVYQTKPDTFYYYPRISWSDFVAGITDNLQVVLPPFDSFIHKNVFHGTQIIPNLPPKLITTYASRLGLVWESELQATIQKYDPNAIEVHPIYYYKDEDFAAWQIYKCIDAGSSFQAPELEWGRSDKFSFESFQKKI